MAFGETQLRRFVGAYAAFYNESIGTTRSRASFFMNKFRCLGFVDYNGSGLEVDSSLLNVVPQGLTTAISVTILFDLLQRPACTPNYEARRPQGCVIRKVRP
jgi:hypothetical protein